MKKLTSFVGWLLLTVAILLYLAGIYYAIFAPQEISKDGMIIGLKIPEPLDVLTASIGAILLTNFGAVLGISIAKPQSAIASRILISSRVAVIPDPPTKKEDIQFLAVVIYLFTLIACFIKWLAVETKSDDTSKLIVPFVEQYGKTLIAIISAYATFLFSAKESGVFPSHQASKS